MPQCSLICQNIRWLAIGDKWQNITYCTSANVSQVPLADTPKEAMGPWVNVEINVAWESHIDAVGMRGDGGHWPILRSMWSSYRQVNQVNVSLLYQQTTKTNQTHNSFTKWVSLLFKENHSQVLYLNQIKQIRYSFIKWVYLYIILACDIDKKGDEIQTPVGTTPQYTLFLTELY